MIKNNSIDERYKNGKVYIIYSENAKLGYVGSTIQSLECRLMKHKTDMAGYFGLLNKTRNYRSSFEVLIYNDYKIILLEDFKCLNRRELEKREALWMLKLSEKINICNLIMPSKIDYSDFDYIKENLTIPVF